MTSSYWAPAQHPVTSWCQISALRAPPAAHRTTPSLPGGPPVAALNSSSIPITHNMAALAQPVLHGSLQRGVAWRGWMPRRCEMWQHWDQSEQDGMIPCQGLPVREPHCAEDIQILFNI